MEAHTIHLFVQSITVSFAYFEQHHFNETRRWSRGNAEGCSFRPTLFVQLEDFDLPTEFSQKIKVLKSFSVGLISNEVFGEGVAVQ